MASNVSNVFFRLRWREKCPMAILMVEKRTFDVKERRTHRVFTLGGSDDCGTPAQIPNMIWKLIGNQLQMLHHVKKEISTVHLVFESHDEEEGVAVE